AFDTSKVTNMSHMFESCQALRLLDLSSFNTSAVTDMSLPCSLLLMCPAG
ncbi:BspA family leucine-rich repeat surface protein, partial [uncultured Duncaniella sp.]